MFIIVIPFDALASLGVVDVCSGKILIEAQDA